MYVNEGFERITGYDPSAALGRNCRFLQGPETDPERVKVLRNAVQEGHAASVVLRNYRADGTPFWNNVTIAPIRTDSGSLTHFVGFQQDVTEREESTRALERHNTHLEALHGATETLLTATDQEEAARIAVQRLEKDLSFSTVGIWLINDDENALEPAAATRPSQELFEDPPTFAPGESLAWEAFQSKEPLVIDDMEEQPGRHNPDTPISSEIVLPLGEYGVLIIGSTELDAFEPQDVTIAELWASTVTMVLIRIDRERLLREREDDVRRERDRLDDFASLMSHDLRNPLTVAHGYLDLAAQDVDNEHLDAVGTALDRMETLIEDMLTLARKGRSVGEREFVSLEEAVEDAWRVTTSREATLRVEGSGTFSADPSRLAQILENLLGNAVMHGGSSVTVRVGTLPDGFYVADDGTGIEPDVRGDVFEAGYSTADDGTGFGLAIVREIVEAHGWEIELSDSEEEGARFEITGVDSFSTGETSDSDAGAA